MKNYLVATIFATASLTSTAQANDFIAIFDPCAYELSEIKSQNRTEMHSLNEVALNKDVAMAKYTFIIKENWIRSNIDKLKDQGFSDAQVEIIWQREFEILVARFGGIEKFKRLTSEKAVADLNQLREENNMVLAQKSARCDTDFLPSAGRVANNSVKVPLTIVGALVGGEEGAKAGENLGKYITMEKNPLKAANRNLIHRPAKEIKQFLNKL